MNIIELAKKLHAHFGELIARNEADGHYYRGARDGMTALLGEIQKESANDAGPDSPAS